MNIFEIILIGLSLSMDAFAVSIILGLKNNNTKTGIITSLFFGLFQFIMPILGYLLGNILSEKIINYQSYFSIIILISIGISMLFEKNNLVTYNKLSIKELFFLSIATSIDAFAIGISFSFLKTNILFSTIIIGIITFIISFIGYFLGHLFNKKAHQYANIIGGITLIIISIKMLLEMLLWCKCTTNTTVRISRIIRTSTFFNNC